MTPQQLAAMMKDADPDGSGEIDFEEFVAVLTVQMEKGGQLASVMSEASSFFGFLNPMNWFASAPAPPPAPALALPAPATPKAAAQPKPAIAPKSTSSPKSATSPKAASPPKSASAPKSEQPPKPVMSEKELREKLRPIFDKFDEDGSGAVSTAEMTKIVKQLKLQMTPQQLAAMMNDADPDGSGEIDFEEFVAVLTVQMEKGGQLASVMSEASSFFGFLNPMNWFASAPAPPPAPAPAPEQPPIPGTPGMTPGSGFVPRKSMIREGTPGRSEAMAAAYRTASQTGTTATAVPKQPATMAEARAAGWRPDPQRPDSWVPPTAADGSPGSGAKNLSLLKQGIPGRSGGAGAAKMAQLGAAGVDASRALKKAGW